MSCNSLYVTATEALSGKSLVVLGVMELLARTVKQVGFFRPIARLQGQEYDSNPKELDRHSKGFGWLFGLPKN